MELVTSLMLHLSFIDMFQGYENATTTITVSLTGLLNLTNPWHVHNFPVVDGCQATSTGGHYDPFSRAGLYMTCLDHSICEVGDLSTKHGRFNTSSVSQTYMDTNLNLFGAYSVVGRSIVIHRSDGSRYACADILPVLRFVTTTAVFENTVVGTIRIRQERFDQTSDSWVLADLRYEDSSTAATTNHNYHVHVSPLSLDDPTNCSTQQTGGHWNPNSLGSSSCTTSPDNWFLCEVGDLSGKHGGINIPSGNASKVMYTDTNLPLTGAYSIGGRSIVIHEAGGGGPRIACGTVGKQARATFDDSSGLSGTVDFLQPTANDSTTITVSLVGAIQSSSGWEIRTAPSIGGCNLTGIVYNPNVTETDTQQVGDLSTKHGGLSLSGGQYSGTFTDSNLPLFGEISIVGRALVLRQGLSGFAYACATINNGLTTSTVVARFEANVGTLRGSITLKQPTYDIKSDTVVTVDIRYINTATAATTQHNYHVHEFPIDPNNGIRCSASSVGGHYNPAGVANMYCTTNEADYGSCEVGDLSGKHGQLDIPWTGTSRVVYSDINLPLGGAWSVAGRTIVIHDPNRAVARLDCANLEHYALNNTYFVSITFNRDISEVDSSFQTTFRNNLAEFLAVPTSTLSITYEAGSVVATVGTQSGGGFSSQEIAGMDYRFLFTHSIFLTINLQKT